MSLLTKGKTIFYQGDLVDTDAEMLNTVSIKLLVSGLLAVQEDIHSSIFPWSLEHKKNDSIPVPYMNPPVKLIHRMKKITDERPKPSQSNEVAINYIKS